VADDVPVGASRPGRIILLNGTSSSGKSTLAKALQAALPDPWLVVGIDTVVFALPGRYLDQPRWSEVFRYVPLDDAPDGAFRIETGELGERLISGLHGAVAALAERGLSVIVDHVLLETTWLDECRALWADIPWLFVGVRCPLLVIERRERERRDRTIGQAAAQFAVVHEDRDYDVEVDTSVLEPDAAAARVIEALADLPRPSA
jgi:chloramphenicol 3-O phosphotransferase